LRAIVADLAVINHWPLGEIESMPISKMNAYHELAVERLRLMRGGGKGSKG